MKLTHLNENGQIQMVDVGQKGITERTARAEGKILISKEALELIKQGALKKGDALITAKVAGIMAAKKTAEIIPLCHNINLNYVDIDFNFFEGGITARSEVRCKGVTGAEMEAIHAVSAALLTIYDMAKAADKKMTITDIKLVEKTGGKSGDFKREV
ncbi:MAG: cyclic pyranopterin monophosphate synthase MoaC [Clostridiales bacterium]|nr:cyclic pyranopterin monophosphate synthase MoaC [Clostridiales bacterium]